MASPPVPSRLMVLMFTDLAGSTGLKSRLGDVAYTNVAARHDELFRTIVTGIAGAQIVNDLGDGFMARFDTASQAVQAALLFQHALAVEPWPEGPIQARIGLHLGEVTLLPADGHESPKIIGLAADIASRVMSLALPGQILQTRAAFDDARQYVRQHPLAATASPLVLRWMAHGPYQFKGSDEPLEVYEVGTEGLAPLAAPPDNEKARRCVRIDQEETLGWRPAVGLEIPGRPGWTLERELGIGGFGEVWLGKHATMREHRVFKFCFDADRLRSFRRELTLFRLLRETLGDRPDIARLYEVQLAQAPYYLESEYSEPGNLAEWAEARGGIGTVPLADRLLIVQRVAEAVAAAHSVGVLHKDIKPSNILMYRHEDGTFRPRISDFGIGILADTTHAKARDITLSGFTIAQLTDNSSSRTGTQMYAPPESMLGKPFTMQGDIYALGVLLFQMVVGDLKRPLTQGWQNDVTDPVLRGDIADCVAGDLEQRLDSATELAERLRTLAQRRAARRRRILARTAVFASVPLLILLLAVIGWVVRERGLRTRAEDAEGVAKARTIEAENQTAAAKAVSRFLQDMLQAADPNVSDRNAALTVREALDAASERLNRDANKPSASADDMANHPEVEAAVRSTIGNAYRALGMLDEAAPHLERALELRSGRFGEASSEAAISMMLLSMLYNDQGRLQDAAPLAEKSLELLRKAAGPEAPSTIQAMINLEQVYANQGRFDDAIPVAERAVELSRRVQGDEHRDTLSAILNLALLYTNYGRFDEAHALYDNLVETSTRVFGPEHPETLTARNNLAVLYQAQGDYERAEPLLDNVLQVRKRRLGEDHPATLNSMNNLAAAEYRLGRLDDAAALFSQVVDLSTRKLGPEHADTLLATINLASIKQDLGHAAEAETLLLGALDAARRTLGETHSITRTAMMSLAAAYQQQKKTAEALSLYERLLQLDADTLGPDHSDTLNTMSDLAGLYHGLQQYDKAEALLLKALDIRLRTTGEDHQDTLILLNNIASMYRDAGKLEEALPYMTRAVAGARRTMPADHWIIAAFLTTQGKLQTRLQRYEEAEKSLLEAHAGMVKTFGEDNQRTMEVSKALIDLYDAWQKPEEAAKWRAKIPSPDAPSAETPSAP